MLFHELCRFTKILQASTKHPILAVKLGLQPCTDAFILDGEPCEPARGTNVLTQKDPSSTATKDCTSPPLSETSSDDPQTNLRLTWPVISPALHRNEHQGFYAPQTLLQLQHFKMSLKSQFFNPFICTLQTICSICQWQCRQPKGTGHQD